MRELSSTEITQVSGGLAPWVGAAAGGFAVGAFSAGASSYLSGDSWQTVVGSSVLGGFAGATGGVAAVTTGVAKAFNTFRSISYSVASSTFTTGGSGGRTTIDIGDQEIAEEN